VYSAVDGLEILIVTWRMRVNSMKSVNRVLVVTVLTAFMNTVDVITVIHCQPTFVLIYLSVCPGSLTLVAPLFITTAIRFHYSVYSLYDLVT